jgi:hypothetical protein
VKLIGHSRTPFVIEASNQTRTSTTPYPVNGRIASSLMERFTRAPCRQQLRQPQPGSSGTSSAAREDGFSRDVAEVDILPLNWRWQIIAKERHYVRARYGQMPFIAVLPVEAETARRCRGPRLTTMTCADPRGTVALAVPDSGNRLGLNPAKCRRCGTLAETVAGNRRNYLEEPPRAPRIASWLRIQGGVTTGCGPGDGRIRQQ